MAWKTTENPRAHVLSVRMSDSEWIKLTDNVKTSGMSQSDYVRLMLVRSPILRS